MSAAFSSLSSADQQRIQQFVDTLHRPAILSSWRLMEQVNRLLAQLLASPSNAASTFVSPASDSILGLLSSLTTTEVVPNGSGLAGAQSLSTGLLLGHLAAFNAMIGTYDTAANVQTYALAVGAGNIS